MAIKRIGGEDLEVDVATYKSVQKEVMQVRYAYEVLHFCQ